MSGPDDLQPRAKPVRMARRVFLGTVGLGAAGLVFGQPKSLIDLSSSLGGIIGGEGTFHTYVVSYVPNFNPAKWTLKVDGLVEKPFELNVSEFMALPARTQIHNFHCVTGWEVAACHWTGFAIAQLIERAHLLPNARYLTFASGDGTYIESLSLSQALDPTVMIAHTLNGKPLTADRGAPLRVVVPKMFGYKGTKWLNRITATSTQDVGYWEPYGYSTDGWIN